MRVMNQKRYDASFRAGALALLARDDRTINDVARSLGIDWTTLRRWYDGSEMAKRGKLPGKQHRASSAVMSTPSPQTDKERIAELERELEASQKKIEQLEMDRAILKKAAAFFAKESE